MAPVVTASGQIGSESPLVVCGHCGSTDRGTFCSACGHRLSRDAAASLSAMAWEHFVQERLEDVLSVLKTTWLLIFKPVRFFRGALLYHARFPLEPFPLAGLWRVVSDRPQAIRNPVKYLVLSVAVVLLVGIVTGDNASPFAEEDVLPFAQNGVDGALGQELGLLMQLFSVGIYSVAFSFLAGRRISSGEVARFSLYNSGAAFLLVALMMLTPESLAPVLLVELTLIVYVSILLPYVVLPKIYRIKRGELFLLQVGSGILTFVAALVIGLAVGALLYLVGGAA